MIGITTVERERFQDLVGVEVNPFLSVALDRSDTGLDIQLTISRWQEEAHPRALAACRYIKYLAKIARGYAGGGKSRRVAERLIFQAEDVPAPVSSVSWQRRMGGTEISLVPDLYYFENVGYQSRTYDLLPWHERTPRVIWRGSTSGQIGLTEGLLGDLPRYRLCRFGRTLPDVADFKFTSVVQALTTAEHLLIEARLREEELLGDYREPQKQAHCRFVIDIDGNANSWNFIARLLLGCCILKVASPWEQWFSGRLIQWRHYVPLASDLHDLVDKIDWCLANDVAAERIATAGRQLALDMAFDEEMLDAARTLLPPSSC